MNKLNIKYKEYSSDDLIKKLENFKFCKKLNVIKFIQDSETIYNSEYDFMYKTIKLSIVKYENKLYIINTIDNERWVEPLLVQVDELGNLVDFFFLDFISSYREDIEIEYIYYLNFSDLMDLVRNSIGCVEFI